MKILVIGDACTDIFIRGKVNRLCPEAPVPVLNPTKKSLNPGMAGNVAANLKSLAPDWEVDFVHQDTSIVKTRYVDDVSGYILLRVDEDDKIIEKLTLEKLIERIPRSLDDYDAIVISDYNKGFLTEENLNIITNYVRGNCNALIFLDTKKILGPWSRWVNVVKINNREYEEQLKHNTNPELFCGRLIVTLGSGGSQLIGESELVVRGNEVEVIDVSGAGDTYLAAFVIGYLQSEEILASMKYANKAAGIAVSKQGVVAVKKSEMGD